MSEVLVLIHASEAPNLPHIDGAVLVPFTSTLDVVVSLRASPLPAVICTDTIPPDESESLVTAIRERAGPSIEVRLAGWDGESHSPISAACRGVVSGFGTAGVVRAANLLASDTRA